MISAKTTVAFAMLTLAWAMARETVAQEKSAFATRALATEDYDEAGVSFNLQAEQARLQEWLAIEGNRERLAREPLCIYLFNWLGAEQGGPLSQHLVWLPRRILPAARDVRIWDYSMAMSSPEDRVVALFSEEEWNQGSRPPQAQES